MRKYLLVLAGLLSLLSPAAQAANSTVSAMTAASALGGTELLYVVQGAADRKGTPAQFATYIYGLASGDCTISGVGAVVCTKTNGVAFTAAATTAIGTSGATIPLLSTANTWTLAQTFTAAPVFSTLAGGGTQCVQVSNTGVQTGTGSACGSGGSTGANPTATASDTAVNGVATTFMRSDGAPAIQKASAAQFGVVEVDGTTITATAGVISFNAPINAQVGTTYTVLSSDKGKVITLTNASPIAVTIPVASTAGFGAPFYTSFINEGAGLVTLTPTTSTIDGAASLTVKQGQSVDLITDGTNYFTLKGRPTNVAPADLVGLGTGVATAAAANLSAAGGITSTIASGTSAMGTSAIASAACATVVTTAATNTATTDVVTASFNGDPTAVTGYIPATAGMLTIIAYPTSGNVNFKVCNNTSASITPGAITLNWRVVR